jgi:transposase
MQRVDGLSGREISRRTGLHRDTVARLLAASVPPKYSRKPAGSKLDPVKDWICEQLEADPRIQSQRLREMAAELGYEGGKTIFDDYVREVRPRFVAKLSGPSSARSIGPASWCSAICGSRARRSGSATARPGAAGS